jgi:cell division protein FtsW
MTIPAIVLLISLSMLTPRQMRRFATIGLLLGIALLVFTIFYGTEIKGARRWLNIAGNSIQASEFIKPFFAIVAAWMFSEKAKNLHFPGILISFALMCILVTLLMMQPDLE